MNVTLLVLAGVIALIPLLLFLFGFSPAQKQTDEGAPDSQRLDRNRGDEGKDDDALFQESDSEIEHVELGSDFRLPYAAKEIIPDNSPYEIYQKTLEIAEIQGKNGNLESARELYQGLLERISSKEIRERIQENIDYLDNYQLIAATKAKEKRQKEKDIELSQNEIRVSMGGRDFLPENIKIDITPPRVEPQISLDSAIDKISEKLSLLQPALSESSARLDELAKYKEDLDTLKDELRSLHNLKEETARTREEKMQRELEELHKLRTEIEKANIERQKNDEISLLRDELDRLKKEKEVSTSSESELLRNQLTRVQTELIAERLRNSIPPVSLNPPAYAEPKTEAEPESSVNRSPDEPNIRKEEFPPQEQPILSESHHKQVVDLQEHISRLTSELARSAAKEGEIAALKDQISQLNERLERPFASESQFEAMKLEIRTLTQELVASESAKFESDALRGELEKMKSELSSGQTSGEAISSLKDEMEVMQQKLRDAEQGREQIDELRTQLAQLQQQKEEEFRRFQERLSEFANSPQYPRDTGQFDTEAGKLRNEIASDRADRSRASDYQQKLNDNIENLSDQIGQTSVPAKPISDREATESAAAPSEKSESTASGKPHYEGGISAETEEITRIEKKGEDKNEEFETLEDYMQGPQYELPSDDDILEKILSDSLKPKEKDKEDTDYEIKKPEKEEEQISEEFDISRLFEKPDNQRPEDEEFYAKFLEKTRPKVKKELPILDVHYKFEKIPESTVLSKEANVIEESFYKYKGMLDKANDFIKRRKVKDALNYYEVIMNQDIPVEFKKMIKRNIDDLNEYLDKYMLS